MGHVDQSASPLSAVTDSGKEKASQDGRSASSGHAVVAEPAQEQVPFTPDTAPPGLAVRRAWYVAPMLLLAFAFAAAAMESSFPKMTYEYGRFIRNLSQDPQLLLPKQASIAVRPLFAVLLILFALFAAGTWRRRVRLMITSVGLYVGLTVPADVAMARLSEVGGPSPFMAMGNVAAGLIGILVAAIAVFTNALLPRDVRVHRERPRRWSPLFVLAMSAGLSAAAVWEIHRYYGGYIHHHLDNLPLLGGSGSVVVGFFVLLPLLLVCFGLLVSAIRGKPKPGSYPSIAFIVPARDEEEMIGFCVRSLAAAARLYPGSVEIIVVENGSSDGTCDEVDAVFADNAWLPTRLLKCPPLGKSRALNVGLANARAEIVVRIDADTTVAPDLLVRAMPHFWDPEVGGVGALPVPREKEGWIAHMRAIETFYGAAFKRVAQNFADCVTVLPGATVAYRRSILLELGGFAEGVNGEDADITVRVGRLGYKVHADSRIRTYTDVPRNLRQLREQRMRWSRGLYHMIGRNRSAISMRQGVRGIWMLPWASFMMFRKLMLVPFAAAAAAMIVVHPSMLPLHEVAAAGAIVIGIQLFQMVAVLAWYRQPALILVLPSYLIFRLIVTYYALETLLTLSLTAKAPGEALSQRSPLLAPLMEEASNLSYHQEPEAIPIPLNSEA